MHSTTIQNTSVLSVSPTIMLYSRIDRFCRKLREHYIALHAVPVHQLTEWQSEGICFSLLYTVGTKYKRT